MYKEILRAIGGIEVYPILSLLIFVAVFAGVIVQVIRLDRTRLRHEETLPLDAAHPRKDSDL